jgi:tetratricopeptide (TPR) repeat protein
MSANSANANSANFRKRQAILCGVSDYSILMGNPLPTVEQEIPAIADTLSNKLHEGYCYKVTPLLNENVTLDGLPTIFAPYTQDSPTDELLFYFSGHGTIYNGEPYFVTHGAASNNPGIKLSDLATQVSSLHPGIKEIFLILDFCHSGGILQAIDLDSINPFVSQTSSQSISQTFSQRIATLTATRKYQLGETKNQFGKSFADYFIEALTNTLPDKNGHISFGRLALYISEQMQTSYVQSPVFYAHALSGHPINKVNKKILLPHRRNPFFTGRVEALSAIETALSNSNSAVITQAQAISGMGGIGKTQTAIEFCYRQIANNSYQTYQTILWVNAENEANFNNSYYDIVDLLNLAGNSSASDGTNDGTNDGVGNEALKVDEVIVLVKRWLANNSNWLIVLDNLEDPKLIKHYLPPQPKGHVLITTRSQSLKGYASIVPLKKMSIETGTLFLLKRASLIPINTSSLDELKNDNNFDNKLIDKLISDAQKIVQAMDGLPLALEQAGAYIQESKCSLADYLKSYEDVRNTANILDNAGEDANDHKSVYTTFKLNFDVVKEKSVAAAKLLEVCSFLDSELIPEEIFTQAGNFLGDELTKLQDNTYEFNNCLKLLLNYSLIERDTNKQSLSIHRLVQTVLRELLSEDIRKLLVDSLAKALWSLSNDDAEDPKNWLTYQKLLPSVTSLFDFAKLYQSNIIETAYLFNQFGLYCYTQALFTESLTFYNQSLHIKKLHFGDNNPSVALTLNNIGLIYNQQGNYSLSSQYLNQSLDICKHHFGDNNPSVALTLNNTGLIYCQQGNYPMALEYLNLALDIYKHLFSDNHPSVAIPLNNIAIIYRQQGNYPIALEYLNLALDIYKHHFGDNHPDVALSLNNIGEIYRQQGNYPIALDFFNQSLDIYKYLFSDKHPSVAIPLNNIGSIYHQQGNYPIALDFYNQSLDIYKHHFGDNHPDVALSLNNIGEIYHQQGNYPMALQHLNQSLSIKKQYFSDNHPSVADSLNHIANVYKEQGNYPMALDFYNQSLDIYKHLFGNNHPDVAVPLNNIGLIYRQQGNYPMALQHLNQSLDIYKHFFGNDHPNVALILNNIGLIYDSQDNYPMALDFYNQSLDIYKYLFGNDHPKVALILNNIGETYRRQGNYPMALQHLNQSLDIYKHFFGNNHPNIAMPLNNIGLIYDSQGNYPMALQHLNQSLDIRKHHFGDNHPDVALSLWGIASIYKNTNKEPEAASHYQQAIKILDKFLPPTHPWIAQLLNQYSQLLLNLNRTDEAQPLLDRLASLK